MIAAHTWRQVRGMVLLYVVLLEVVLVIGVLAWPSLRDETAALAPLRTVMPAEFMRRWVDAVMATQADASYRAYMALQMYFKGVNIIGISCACLFGTGLIAQERENRTLELLLSRPFSRERVLIEKLAVLGAAIALPILLTCWTALPLSWAIGESLPFGEVTLGAAYAALFCLLFLALSAACSIRLRTQVHVAFVVGAVIVFQVCIYFVPDIREMSLFRLSDYDVYGPILTGRLGLIDLLVGRAGWLLLAVAGAGATAWLLFRRAEL